MRSELGKECRTLFRTMMATEFPEYLPDKGQIVPQGWSVWTYPSPTGLFFHIGLVIHNSRDQFTTEGAWSFDGKILPRLSNISEVFSTPAHIRVGRLWSDQGHWWQFVLRPAEYETATLYKDDPIEQCLPLVAPAIADAAKRLKDYLIPLFEKVAEKHGKKPA